MSQFMHGQQTIHPVSTLRKHIVPTHLNLPDQVLTLWSLGLSARQLLLLLVGGGIGGMLWQHLAVLGHFAAPGQALRLLLSLPPFLLALLVAWYQHAGRYLEVWLVVLVRYRLHPKRYLWRSIRIYEQHLFPLLPGGDGSDMEESASPNTRHIVFVNDIGARASYAELDPGTTQSAHEPLFNCSLSDPALNLANYSIINWSAIQAHLF